MLRVMGLAAGWMPVAKAHIATTPRHAGVPAKTSMFCELSVFQQW